MEKGAYRKHGGAAASGGNTYDDTSTAANKTGAGGRHGERTAARERVAGRQENRLASLMEWVENGRADRPTEW